MVEWPSALWGVFGRPTIRRMKFPLFDDDEVVPDAADDAVSNFRVERNIARAAEFLVAYDVARRGEIRGFAYATTGASGSQATGWSGEGGTRDPLGTAIMMLGHRYASGLLAGGGKADG